MGFREKLPLLVLLPVPNRSVIPTEAQRSGGTCCFLPSTHQTLNGSAALSFVIPTEAQRSGGICCFLPSTHQTLNGSAALSFVIPTGA
jgi:hypothetical protein